MNRKYCVAKPANTKETSSKRCQSLALPDHPKITKNIFSFERLHCSILIIAKNLYNLSTKTNDTDKYVDIAKKRPIITVS
jgi:hypothetical protein